jgi:hypothetical protein
MGWNSGTEIFDTVVGAVLDDLSKEEIIERLVEVMEDHDWDGQGDSEFFEHPIVRKIFEERNPEWFKDEE